MKVLKFGEDVEDVFHGILKCPDLLHCFEVVGNNEPMSASCLTVTEPEERDLMVRHLIYTEAEREGFLFKSSVSFSLS